LNHCLRIIKQKTFYKVDLNSATISEDLATTYGNKVRVRACGICIRESDILLVNHAGLRKGDFWSPPGGGIEFGETAQECIKREFREETGLTVSVGNFLFACDFFQAPLHAIELFFDITHFSGDLIVGHDPENKAGEQFIKNVKFFPLQELEGMDKGSLHGIFKFAPPHSTIKELSGYFKL
jgi:8-oxo-dGTP diphosphatase